MTTTIDRKQARKIAQDKSAAGWMIAADALEDQGDDAEAARCRQVGELIGRIEGALGGVGRLEWSVFEVVVGGVKFSLRFRHRYGSDRAEVDVLVWKFSFRRERMGWVRVGKRYIPNGKRGDATAVYEKARSVVALTGLNVNLPK